MKKVKVSLTFTFLDFKDIVFRYFSEQRKNDREE